MRTKELNAQFRRVFAAIVPPVEVQRILYRTSGQLVKAFPDARVRRTAPDHHHITLKFIARAGQSELEGLERRIEEICEQLRPFTLRTGRIESFRGDGQHIFWCSVSEDEGGSKNANLTTIYRHLNGKVAKNFTPHITIARLKSGVRRSGLDIDLPTLAFMANELSIIESHLTPSGPRYDVIARHRFSD
jgi:2'-5' RNA ligase